MGLGSTRLTSRSADIDFQSWTNSVTLGKMVMMKDRIGTEIEKTKKRVSNMYSTTKAAFEGLGIVGVPVTGDKPIA